jgi:two-component system chemotaxis sensor kinase CheA
MHALSKEIDQLNATLIGVDPSDLQALAEAHAKFEALSEAARNVGGVDSATATTLSGITAEACRSLEQLILNETKNADQALQSVLKTIADVQSLLTTGAIPDVVVADDTVEAAFGNSSAPAQEATPSDFPQGAPVAEAPKPADAIRIFAEDEIALLQEFITESSGHLETAEQEMLTLEDDPSNKSSLDSLFRAFHTIKGVAGFLDLKQMQALAHITENLLDKGRKGEVSLTGTPAELVLNAIDTMKALVNAVQVAVTGNVPLISVGGVEGLVQSLQNFLDGKTVSVVPAKKPAAVPQVATPGVPATTTCATAASGENVEAAEAPKANCDQVKGPDAKNAGDGTVKVATDRLDNLIDMVGELVIANSMVAQDLGGTNQKDIRLSRHLGHLGKIVRELQDLSMSLRMVQVGTVFRKMSRLVRDCARKMNKEVELVIEGGDTELDRNVVEALNDPLVHMVRNSIDHGIELPEERQAKGKPRIGKIVLSAYHKGGSINIEVTDDGKGLNKDRILKKAVQNGIVSEEAARTITDADVHRLIFAAGLSTAEKVTDISGRGVGMDVVKQNIEKLRGRVDITSEPNKGSVFTIRLPLTLAVIDGLVVKVGPQKYILPILSIEQSVRPTNEMLSTVQGRGEIVTMRGSILPLIRLHRLFSIEPRTTDPTQALVVVVQDNDRRACLLVDELLGQEQVVIKSLGKEMGRLPGISGGAVLGDGNVSLIIDVPGLIELS